MRRSLLGLTCLILAACGDAPTSEAVGKTAAALTDTGLLPYPVKIVNGAPALDGAGKPLPAWNGSVVDVMAADAFAQCAASSPWPVGQTTDAFLMELSDRMNTAMCPIRVSSSPGFPADPASLPGAWALSRLTPDCNADPSTGKKRALTLTPASRHPIPGTRIDTGNAARRAKAEYEVNYAETNLCMAQRLREHTASGEVLFLSAAEQRQLLETIRERAQVAMLQYAALGTIFSTSGGSLAQTDVFAVVPTLQQWAQSTHANDITYLRELGAEFAQSVQLHSVATRELSDLLWRSATAHVPRASRPGASAEDNWGAGTWRQRMMALLYGGDPLVDGPIDQALMPWDRSDPGDPRSTLNGLGKGTVTWPNDSRGPSDNRDPSFVSSRLTAPEITTLTELARRADLLNLKLTLTSSPTPSPAQVDRPASAAQLYKAVEAHVRTNDCNAVLPLSCNYQTVLSTIQNDNLASAYEQYRLWRKLRIRPSHAEALVAQLAEAIPKVTLVSGVATESQGHWPGAMRLLGANNAIVQGSTLGGGASGSWYHLDGNAEIMPLDNVDRSPLYARLAAHRLPTAVNPTVQAQWTGLVGHLSSNEPARILGATSAESATRDALRASLLRRPAAGLAGNAYFASAEKILNLIDAGVGTITLDVHPSLQNRLGRAEELSNPSHVLDGCWNRTSSVTCSMMVQNGTPTSNVAQWEVAVTLPNEHAFAPNARLLVFPAGSLASTLARKPTAKTFWGKDMAAIRPTAAAAVDPSESTTLNVAGTRPLRHHRYIVNLPTGSGVSATKKYSFVLESGTQYLPLGEDVELTTLQATFKDPAGVASVIYYPAEGQFLALDGDAGLMARQAWAMRQHDWAEPAYDAFGLPTQWVPPSDPRLFGGGEDAASYYLRSAANAADQATLAVKSAMEEILKQETDEAALSSARRRAAEIGVLEQRALCGPNTSCDTSTMPLRPVRPSFALDCSDATINAYPTIDELTGADQAKKDAFRASIKETCLAFQQGVNRALDTSSGDFVVGKPVYDARFATVPPDFAAYRGGTLQGIYIDQWASFRHVENSTVEVVAAAAAAWARVDEAYRYQAFKKYKTSMACGRDLAYAVLAGLSASFGPGEGGWGLASLSWSPGPLLNALAACQDARTEEGIVGEAPLVSAISEAYARVASMATTYTDSVATLQGASARGQKVLHEAGVNKARADLEATLAADTVVTKFGTYRRYHSYDMWRARALLESARRYGAAARRAIESRLVVNLSDLHGAEPFVAAPTTWADEIYEYDLDAPSSVGLSVAPKTEGGVYPNRITDYVGNLERFVHGYAIARPTSVARRDDEVMTIGGPDDRMLAADGVTRVLTQDARRWQFQCADGTWLDRVTLRSGATPPTERALATLCNGAPAVRARLRFSLDPWGRLEGDIAREPFKKRHNSRWTRMVVNLVGTGIRDCALARDPATCYSQPFLGYDLAHTGPSWATNHALEWRLLDIGAGRIEGGKALAAEQWLDPVSNGWGKPYVEAVARTELTERPFGGAYAIELELGPEAKVERIERVQILAESTYWVSQN